MQNPWGWRLYGRLPLSRDPHGGPSPAPKGCPVPGACSVDCQRPWGWGLSLAPPGRMVGRGGSGKGRRATEGWGKARVLERRPPFNGETSPGGHERETALSRGSPGKEDWRAKVGGTADASGAPAGPHALQPGATRPGTCAFPTPSTAPPASRSRPGVSGPRRRGQHSRRTHTRVPPARLRPARSPGWCSRRRWAASNAAHRASPAQPPPPPRRSPPPSLPNLLVAPHRPGPALLGIVRTLLAGCSGWPCSRLQRSVLRAQWPYRLPQHKAGVLPTPLPPRPHWSTCNLGVIQDFCSLLTWRLAGLGFPGSARLHILAVAWDPSGARAPAARGVRAPAGLPGGRREDTHCGSLSPRAGSRAPRPQPVTSSLPPAPPQPARGRGRAGSARSRHYAAARLSHSPANETA